LKVWFRGIQVGEFRAGMVIENRVLVELKAGRGIGQSHEAQLLHYLPCTEIELGLLLNFGLPAQFRRLVFENRRKKSLASRRQRPTVAAFGEARA
jgi:GxxExxY protein